MKSLRPLLLFVLTALLPSFLRGAEPASVQKWDIFEIELKGPTEGNPFTEVRVGAVFTNGTVTVEVPGFYDGDGVYRVRFSPLATGAWRYETKSNRWELTGKLGTFAVTPAAKGNHGPVRVHNTFHFAYADGTPFKPVGTTIYNWLDTPAEVQEQTLQTLAAAPKVAAGLLSSVPCESPLGERRIPTRSAPHTSISASSTSRMKRVRFSGEPPYSSVRRLVPSRRNWSTR